MVIPTSRIIAKREELLGIRNQLREQLAGVENQLYVLDQLLNPPAPTAPPTPPPADELPLPDGCPAPGAEPDPDSPVQLPIPGII